MTWTILLGLLLQFVGPLLLKWLEDLLRRTSAAMEAANVPTNLPPAVQELAFWSKAQEIMEKEGDAISSWNWWGKWIHKRRATILNRTMKAAIERLGSFAKGYDAEPMTTEEIKHILSA